MSEYALAFGAGSLVRSVPVETMYEVRDQVFFVTGGAAGIGEGCVRAFLDEGAKHVAVLDLDAYRGARLEKELGSKHGPERVKFYQCDVTTDQLSAAYDSVLKEFGYIDVVLNCAGILNDHPNMYEKSIAINVTALIKSSFRAYNIMRTDKGGRGGTIINISSIAALFQGSHIPVYNATKSAVLQFSTNLGLKENYDASGVRVVTLCFGCTDTALLTTKQADTFDESNREGFFRGMGAIPWQTTENAVRGLMHAYKHGDSASTWLVTSNRDAEDITGNVTEAYEVLRRGVFD